MRNNEVKDMKPIEPDFWSGRGRYSKTAIKRAAREAREVLKGGRSGGDHKGVSADTQAHASADKAKGAEAVGTERKRLGRGRRGR